MKRTSLWAGTALAAALLASAAFAQTDKAEMAAAKKEGNVSWYTSTPIATAQKMVNAFEQENPGIKVQLFRSGGEKVMSRFMQEHDAGHIGADVMTTSDPPTSAVLTKKGFFVPFKPANFDKIPAAAKDKDGNWIAQRINMLMIYLRGDKVKAADRPKSWTDLTNAKYKGMEVMPDPSFTSLQMILVYTLSKKYGWDFYEKIHKNDVMIVQSHQQVQDAIKRGERTIAAEGDFSYAIGARKAGHDIVIVNPSDGVLAVPSPTAIIKGAAHPNAAKVLASWMIGDTAQKLIAAGGSYSPRTDIQPPQGAEPLSKLKLMDVDYEAIEKETGAVKKKFNDIFQ